MAGPGAGPGSESGAPAGSDASGSGANEATADLRADSERVAALAAADRREKLRVVEAVLFAAPEPIDESRIAEHLVEGTDIAGLLAELRDDYSRRGVNLVQVAGKWAFRTAEDLSFLLQRYSLDERKLSKAALETLSIIAYHQPVTRAEIEEVRGVSTSAGTIDILLDTGWIRPRGRRRAPGRPVTYGTTEAFLNHFGLATIKDLPGLAELKGSGLLDANLPPGFAVPEPSDVAALMPDELPLDASDDDAAAAQVELEFGSDFEAEAEGGIAPGRDGEFGDDGAKDCAGQDADPDASPDAGSGDRGVVGGGERDGGGASA
ncbi:MAG: SMC-Scp complex subunit ScpB [Hyphomicrobiaceae bacterium]|nr:SMC-Scp complex subunit ScpB [Hyphomicrobiaceae bacterium]